MSGVNCQDLNFDPRIIGAEGWEIPALHDYAVQFLLDVRVLKRARDYHVTDKSKIIFQNCFWFLTYSTTTSNNSFGP